MGFVKSAALPLWGNFYSPRGARTSEIVAKYKRSKWEINNMEALSGRVSKLKSLTKREAWIRKQTIFRAYCTTEQTKAPPMKRYHDLQQTNYKPNRQSFYAQIYLMTTITELSTFSSYWTEKALDPVLYETITPEELLREQAAEKLYQDILIRIDSEHIASLTTDAPKLEELCATMHPNTLNW